MYTALYRAYRPEIFDEILGQEHIVKILKNQIDTDTTSHAYLFCGTRGTGKTTTARILAKGLNCLADEGGRPCGHCSACVSIKEGTYIDVIEIDAASNNGVDNIRELRESVKYPPAVGRKKVYIIDEVHMLSSGAFNALLKTLEEPPEYVVFILATTEPQKLPATILSRCMRLDFRRVPESVLIKGMADICAKRGIDVSEDALRIIAANADGSVRDGLSILDQCISGGDVSVDAEDVLGFLGASGEEVFIELTDMVRKGKTADALVHIDGVLADGKDVRQFIKDWITHYRNLLMAKFIRDPQDVISMSVENIERIRKQSESTELADINRGILELSKTAREARWSTQPRILLELAAVTLSSGVQPAAAPQQFRTAPAAMQPEAAKPVTDASAAVKGSGKKTAAKETAAAADEAVSTGEEALTCEAASEDEAAFRTGETASEDDAASIGEAVSSAETADGEEQGGGEAFDLDALWKAVFEDGEAAKGSFYIIGSGARLTDVGEYEFTITAGSDHVKNHAENNRQLLEDLMEKHTGRHRSMKVKVEGGEVREEKTAEAIAKEAGEILGIDVEIK